MVAATIQSAWAEVKKSNPCPLCGKPDWCSVSENGEAVLCRRLDPGSQPPDWKHIKDSSDGFPIFALNKGEQFFKSFKPIKYRQNNNKSRTAHQYAQHRNARNDVNGVYRFFRKKVSFGNIACSIQSL